MAADGPGTAYVTGLTWSGDLRATASAFDPTYNGHDDTF